MVYKSLINNKNEKKLVDMISDRDFKETLDMMRNLHM